MLTVNPLFFDYLKRSPRWHILSLVILLVVLLFTGLGLLSYINLQVSQRALGEAQQTLVSEGFEKRRSDIDHLEQNAANLLRAFHSAVNRLHEESDLQRNALLGGDFKMGERMVSAFALLLPQDAELSLWYFPESVPALPKGLFSAYRQRDKNILPKKTRSSRREDSSWLPLIKSVETGDTDTRVRWTTVYYDMTAREARLTAALPLYDQDKTLIGYTAIHLNAETLGQSVDALPFVNAGFSFLLDSNNRKLTALTEMTDAQRAQKLIDGIVSLQLTNALPGYPNDETIPATTVLEVDGQSWDILYARTSANMIVGAALPADLVETRLEPLVAINLQALLWLALLSLVITAYLLKKIAELLRALRQMYQHDISALPNENQLAIDIQHYAHPAIVALELEAFESLRAFFREGASSRVQKEVALAIETAAGFLPHNRSAKVYHTAADRFAVVVDAKDGEIVNRCVKTLLERLESLETQIEGFVIPLIFHCGVVIPTEESTPNDKQALIAQAEIAVTHARKTGITRLQMTEQRQQQSDYQEMIRRSVVIREALAKGNVTTWYQPIRDNHTGVISKYECLIRIKDSQGTVLSPGHFLPTAQRFRLSKALTCQVIERAFQYFTPLSVEFSINLSLSDMLDDDIAALIQDQLVRSQAGRRVIFEILEDDTVENFQGVIDFIKRVKAFGCRMAIDDFGTGYSNFERLMLLQIDFIKIDGSLIKNIHEDSTSAAIVSGIVQFCKMLGIQTVAEFVHCQEVQDEVKRLGIDFTQGALFGMPAPDVLTVSP
jgi:EAL domain-containing protein (putative c-di-GMP-specific phosphodiesterase class I)